MVISFTHTIGRYTVYPIRPSMLLHPPRFSINDKCSDMKFGTVIIDLDLDVSNGSAKGTLKPLLTKYGAIMSVVTLYHMHSLPVS